MGYLGNPTLVMAQNWMIAGQGDLPIANVTSPTNPTITTNPVRIPFSWANTVTGEVFICTDNTTDFNVWVGSLGGRVDGISEHSPIAWWDFSDATNLFVDAGAVNVSSDGLRGYIKCVCHFFHRYKSTGFNQSNDFSMAVVDGFSFFYHRSVSA